MDDQTLNVDDGETKNLNASDTRMLSGKTTNVS
jgi:hypothetical protein